MFKCIIIFICATNSTYDCGTALMVKGLRVNGMINCKINCKITQMSKR